MAPRRIGGLAWQRRDGPHNFEVGTYGMVARVFVDEEDDSLESDRFRDVAFDASYQYISDQHQWSAHTTWIDEKQDWNTSFDQGLSSRSSTSLKTFRVDGHYFFRRQWSGGAQYFQTRGSSNDLRYNTGEPVLGSANGSPNSKGWIAELDWRPIPNIKLGICYAACQQFNGGRNNYEGFGRNARDNNSVFVLAWMLI